MNYRPLAILLASVIGSAVIIYAVPPLDFTEMAAASGQTPLPSQYKLRLERVIADLQTGSLDLDQFEPTLRVAVKGKLDLTKQYFAAVGPLQSVVFIGAANGGEVFDVKFQEGSSTWWIKIASNGNVAGLYFRQ